MIIIKELSITTDRKFTVVIDQLDWDAPLKLEGIVSTDGEAYSLTGVIYNDINLLTRDLNTGKVSIIPSTNALDRISEYISRDNYTLKMKALKSNNFNNSANTTVIVESSPNHLILQRTVSTSELFIYDINKAYLALTGLTADNFELKHSYTYNDATGAEITLYYCRALKPLHVTDSSLPDLGRLMTGTADSGDHLFYLEAEPSVLYGFIPYEHCNSIILQSAKGRLLPVHDIDTLESIGDLIAGASQAKLTPVLGLAIWEYKS